MQKVRSKPRLLPSNGRPDMGPLDMARPCEVDWEAVRLIFEAGRLIKNVSYVYAIGEHGEGAVKIGLSTNPIKRLRTMQTGNPRQLIIEQVLIGDRRIEQLLHLLWEPFALFAKHRPKQGLVQAPPETEWFRSDARPLLMPMLAEVACQQAAYMADRENKISLQVLERIVRQVHKAGDIELPNLDLPRRLGRHVGYAQPRSAAASLLSGN